MHTENMQYDDKGRDWGDAAEDKEHQRFPANQQKLGERHGADFRRNQPHQHLDLGLLAFRTLRQ